MVDILNNKNRLELYYEIEEIMEEKYRAKTSIENFKNKLFQGDCLELMKDIPDKSIDMVLCDLPYGTTACKWDVIIPFNKYIVEKIGNKEKYVYQEEYVSKRFKEGIYNYPKIIEEFNNLAKDGLWEQYKRIIKDNGAIVLTASQPFSSLCVASNINNFKYEWVWDKKIPSGMCNAKIQPMRQHEVVLIFMNGKSFYYPEMMQRDKPIKSGGMQDSLSAGTSGLKRIKKEYTEKYPTTIISFDKVRRGSLHPTQKPVALFEYLIKTYTNEGGVVLDNCAGSGTTAISCLNTNRNFILMEKETKYCEVIINRIKEYYNDKKNIKDEIDEHKKV